MSGTVAGKNVCFLGVTTDSRNVAAGQLFVALRGERFDGHAFVGAAKKLGAAAAVVDVEGAEVLGDVGLPLIVVADTRLALGALAAAWRARFSLPVIAVTGSNGKTTSKEMIASIMQAAFGDAVLATQGNFNNDIGLPLTLLKLDASHRAAVIEMGMNHPGEIAYLAGIARPTVALVTNAQRAHLAGMGSLDSIAVEKGSLFTGLAEDGVAVFSADEPWGDVWRSQIGTRKVMTFACERPADVTGNFRTHGLENHVAIAFQGAEVAVDLALPGAHNARNALGAATAALAAGVSLAEVRDGLAAFRGIKGRLQRKAGLNGAVLLDDTYNANPDSVCAAIDVLASTVGKQILVLGDMGEIGEMSGQFHDEVGGYAKSQGIDQLLAFGEASAIAAHNFGAGGRHFKKLEDLIETLKGEMTPETIVLVKGSRFMRMERVVDAVAAAQTEGGK
nr:UDP-N-acetylmuramoyl-tripeptide--D-alanyl-D-alanine ligase [Propionivibrio limicola]